MNIPWYRAYRREYTIYLLVTGEIWSLSNKSGYKQGNKWNLVFKYVPSTFIMYICIPVSFMNPLTQPTLLVGNKKRMLVNLKWREDV
jgi:hypothetical protein